MMISCSCRVWPLADEKVPVIGVVQFVQHEALIVSNQGFRDALEG